MATLMNGTYFEIIGGMSEDIILNTEKTDMADKQVKAKAANTERYAYKNTYKDGKRIKSEKLYDPHDDEFFAVGDDALHYEPLPKDMSFRYSMLARLKNDCEYVINNKISMPHNFFWAGSPDAQIKEMRDRWNSFADDEKPEWLTMEQIDAYEKELAAL